ncbi:uncharacterized protein LOC131062499 isoform X2 [Cryptomeria japonica]|uniref:uncharacterized protein LOC131062499 isoform X2 n=1 Tax=Cryptomeria japonica TaxID=3369 RepID=UPI0025AD5A42|nr:uncharacterized protein LOC131062499 isoform X2 [Cryptomeria japonica]
MYGLYSGVFQLYTDSDTSVINNRKGRLAKVRSRCPMNYFQWMWFAWLPVCHLRNLSKHLICFTVGIQGDMQNSIPDQPHHPPLNITSVTLKIISLQKEWVGTLFIMFTRKVKRNKS